MTAGRGKVPEAALLALLERGDQKTPDRSRDHDARGKAGEGALKVAAQIFSEKEDGSGAEGGAEEGNQYPDEALLQHSGYPFKSKSNTSFSARRRPEAGR